MGKNGFSKTWISCIELAAVIIFFVVITKMWGYVSAKDVFKMRLADPIPATVKILRGRGTYAGMGGSSYMVFKTDKDTFKQLSVGYKLILDCSNLLFYNLKDFAKDLKNVRDVQCYQKKDGGFEWNMFYDEANNTVYFDEEL